MRALPTRQLIYYCTALRLARTLKHVRQNSLRYTRALAENPGPQALDELMGRLGKVADLCLQCTEKSYPLIEMQLHGILASLPFSWPEELLEEPESFLAVSQSEVDGVISQSSSGTTGLHENKFKRVFCTGRDQEATIAFFAAGMRYLIDPSRKGPVQDKVAMLLSAGRRGGGNLADLFGAAMARIGAPFMTPSNPFDESSTLAELAAFRPSCIIGTPRQVISLFREDWGAAPEAGPLIARVKSGLKNVLLSGDRVSSALNGILKRELGADIFMHYGMVETGLGTAVECPHKRGAHYRESDFFIEIVTPDGVSHPCPQPSRSTIYIDPDDMENGCIYGPSPWGEVTVTSLSREASPLIRYRTGDSGRIIVDGCACGSALWRLEVRGRLDDHIKLADESGRNVLEPPLIEYTSFDGCLYRLPWIKDYQVSVHSGNGGGPRDLGVIILLGGSAPESDQEAAHAVRQALAPVAARALPHGVNIHIRPVRDRQEFCGLFRHSPKRSFPRSAAPLDLAAYVS